MKLKVTLTSLVLLVCTAPAFATLTGEELLNRCKATGSDYKIGFCRGYIASFLDTYVLTHAVHKVPKGRKLFCLPSDGIPLRSAVDVAVQYHQANNKDLHKSARTLLFKAFMKKYPCGAPKGSGIRGGNSERRL